MTHAHEDFIRSVPLLNDGFLGDTGEQKAARVFTYLSVPRVSYICYLSSVFGNSAPGQDLSIFTAGYEVLVKVFFLLSHSLSVLNLGNDLSLNRLLSVLDTIHYLSAMHKAKLISKVH
jgi:hypothetical protein